MTFNRVIGVIDFNTSRVVGGNWRDEGQEHIIPVRGIGEVIDREWQALTKEMLEVMLKGELVCLHETSIITLAGQKIAR